MRRNTPTLRMYAATDGSVEIVKDLIDSGASVNARTTAGDTPLTLAALRGHTEVVEVLLEKGAGLEDRNEFAETALMCAAIASFPDIVQLLVQNGADVDARDLNGRTALMMVCDNGKRHGTESLRALLQASADFRAKDMDGMTALMLAARNSLDEAVKILVTHDAKRTAIKPCIAAIVKNGRDEDAYRILRKVYLALRRYRDAIAISKRAVSALPDKGQPYYNLGTAYLAAGDMENARAMHELLLRKAKESPDGGSTTMYLGWAGSLKETLGK